MKYIWTEEMDSYLKENYMTKSLLQIWSDLGFERETRAEISRRAKVLNLHRPNGRDFNENFFDEWSEEMAYVLGFIFADGNIMYKDKDKYDLCIRLAYRDLETLQSIARVMECKRPPRVYQVTNSKVKKPGNWYCVLTVTSKHCIERLMELGIETNKSNKEMHCDVPDKYFRQFLLGFFDGDGHVMYVNRKVSPYIDADLHSSSREFLEYLQANIPFRMSLKVDNRASRNIPIYRLTITCSNCFNFLTWLYNDQKIKMERKYKVYSDYRQRKGGIR